MPFGGSTGRVAGGPAGGVVGETPGLGVAGVGSPLGVGLGIVGLGIVGLGDDALGEGDEIVGVGDGSGAQPASISAAIASAPATRVVLRATVSSVSSTGQPSHPRRAADDRTADHPTRAATIPPSMLTT
ncbi:hypothetical protein Q9S78_08675 [Microbacterium sp. KSW-18]|uniref:Uncharacterized protein n=1 Tax=Microbacterium aquilitoris TaxID=3067307 RepID=A0ABU3GJ69_9MICO|nr:hypothetical protein [Microbacterium sp. KSW-18]MDT3330746.1 hypothetical protein [Microbacterium sp. KSW-18]